MNCTQCNDTGSLSKNVTGFLDCPHCDATEERMRVEAWARRAAPGADLIDVWIIYQHGKAAAKPLAPQAVAAKPAARVPQPSMVDRKCAWCKDPFQARAVDVARGWGKFCSKSCKAMRQEKKTGQYRALQEHGSNSFGYGHIFASGDEGHGQN